MCDTYNLDSQCVSPPCNMSWAMEPTNFYDNKLSGVPGDNKSVRDGTTEDSSVVELSNAPAIYDDESAIDFSVYIDSMSSAPNFELCNDELFADLFNSAVKQEKADFYQPNSIQNQMQLSTNGAFTVSKDFGKQHDFGKGSFSAPIKQENDWSDSDMSSSLPSQIETCAQTSVSLHTGQPTPPTTPEPLSAGSVTQSGQRRTGKDKSMGRGDGFDSRGKREFDRHSGNDKSSNQKVEEKRGGAGSHNWGNTKDEASELEQTAAPEAPAEGEEHAPADSENKENEVEEVKDEGPKEMTLDEWKAMQDKERAKVEFNIRKPNEGEDGQWKKGYVLHKSKSKDAGRPSGALIEAGDANAEAHHKGATEEGTGDHHFRKPANDITSQLEINFGDLGRPGRGRGGSRGGRGGRGGGSRAARGGSRSDKGGGVSVPNVDDPEAFPALA